MQIQSIQSGCTQRNCPCDLKLNCTKYRGIILKYKRLDETIVKINDWYKVNFRLEYKIPDLMEG